MPINLRYGQQAVARGFINKQRLDQVLAKQRQLADQGKKVSVRMILEKAKLLSREQLTQIDRDLNIKVVKKHTTQIKKPGAPQQATGAQNFAGEAVPQFSGMQGADPDATVFSPPPADMQDKIRAEREKAKAEQRHKQEQEASAFFGDDGGSPFGGDPFGGDMSPEPMGGEMSPEPAGFGDDPFGGGDMSPEPFGGEMEPEPAGGFAEMQPMGGDPFGGDDLSPQPAGFDDDQGFGNQGFDDQGFGNEGYGNEPAELDRMDSSPKLASLGAEFDGFANPEDEELPTMDAGFGDDQGFGQPQQQQWGQQQPQYDEGPSLAPSGGDDFNDFGNDIRSPEELESAPPKGSTKPIGADMDATMFSPPPPGMTSGGRQKTGAMDRTVFSPRPPEFGGAQPMEAEPAGDDWGEEPSMDAGFGDDDGGFGGGPATPADAMDATLFSPPPAQMPPARKATGPVSRDTGRQRGRKGDDDFGDVEFPKSGQRVDDVPTAPASMDDEVHPLRRGVGTSSAGIKRTSRKQQPFDEEVADELPDDGGVDVPDDIPDELPEDVPPIGKGKGKLPGKAPKAPKPSKRELPQKEVPATDKKEKKGAGKRVLLMFTILLLVFVALIVLPIVLEDQVPEIKQLRRHEQAEPIYNYVDYEIMDRIREWTGQPTKKPKPPMREIQITPPGNGETPSNEPAGDTGGDTGGETAGEGG